ncbi:MAG: hypothetical protein ACI9W4_001038 [Rhodothermales bacterium]|jgi:hypothetical protein
MTRIVIGAFLFVGFLAMPFEARTNSSGAPAGRTGSPAENGMTCNSSGCHFGNATNSGTGSIAVSAPMSYGVSQTVALSITVEQEGAQRIGFQVSVVDANNSHVGTLKIVDSANTKFASNNSAYITHANAPTGMSTRTFDIEWDAPSTPAGTVFFYITGNAANGNGGATGDNIYSTQFPMAESGTAIEAEAVPSHFAVTGAYPNPVADQALVGVSLPQPTDLRVVLMDVLGREVSVNRYNSLGAGVHDLPVSVSGLAPGAYVVVVSSTSGRVASHSLLVQ